MNKEPMSLENLPEYLKAQREGRSMGNAPVVNMGQIVVPEKPRTSWLPKLALVAVMLVAVGVGGLFTYDVMSTNQMTILVDIDQNADPFQTIPTVVSDSGGRIIAVKQKDADTYEIKVTTRQSKNSFLDWLRKSKDVKKATLEE